MDDKWLCQNSDHHCHHWRFSVKFEIEVIFYCFFLFGKKENFFFFLSTLYKQTQTCLLHSKKRFKNLKEYLFFLIAFYTLCFRCGHRPVTPKNQLQKTNSSHNIFSLLLSPITVIFYLLHTHHVYYLLPTLHTNASRPNNTHTKNK